MHHAAILDRGRGRLERLAEHLPAEYLRRAGVAALATEQVHLETLEVELLLQIDEPWIHAASLARSGS